MRSAAGAIILLRPYGQAFRHGKARHPAPPVYLREDSHHTAGMEELLRSNDPVYLSFVRHVLNEAGIGFLELDSHTSAVEGSIGVIPRRIVVAGEDLDAARRALGNASLTITL